MIRCNKVLNKWVVDLTAGMKATVICENYKEAWFFRTYEEDMNMDFVRDYRVNR